MYAIRSYYVLLSQIIGELNPCNGNTVFHAIFFPEATSQSVGVVITSYSIHYTKLYESPLVGMVLSYFIMILVMLIFKRSRPARVDKGFRVMQLFSSAVFSLGHGSNDAQKTMSYNFV